jgi:TonB family protein
MDQPLAIHPFSAGAPGWMRLSAAIVISIALHSVALNTLNAPPGGAPGPRATAVLSARFPPLTVPGRDAIAPALPKNAARETPGERDRSDRSMANSKPDAIEHLGGPVTSLRYYLGSELDQRAVPLQPIEPEYPIAAGVRDGALVLRLLINEHGRVDDIIVARAEPEGVFESSARSAFAGARFSPGVREGAPVKSQLLVEVNYRHRTGDPVARSGAAYGD